MLTRLSSILAFLAAVTAPAPAQDWARVRTGAERTVFFKAAVPLGSFKTTFIDALDRAAPLRFSNFEAGSSVIVGGGIDKPLAPGLTADELATIKAALRRGSRRLVAYSVPAMPTDEPAARALAQFAKELGVETIVAGVAAESPGKLKVPPPAAVTAVRLADTAGLREYLLAIYRAKAKPPLIILPAAASRDPVADLSVELDSYEAALSPVMADYAADLGRITPIRTLDAQTRLTPEERADAKRKLEAAFPAQPQVRPRKARKLLVFDLQVGYPGHPSIPYANYVLSQFGRKTGAWEATFSNDLANFHYQRLRQYDAVFLNNTVGLIFNDPEIRASIVRFLKEGGGLAGYHASTHASIDWPEFTEIIGASSGAHREATEKVTIRLDDAASPINAVFGGQPFVSIDEHFRWNNYSRQRVRVLLSIDVANTDMNQGRGCDICTRADNDYAVSWIRSYGKGRVFYTSLGHGPAAFMDAKILGHMLAGIQFALGDLDADTAPANGPPR